MGVYAVKIGECEFVFPYLLFLLDISKNEAGTVGCSKSGNVRFGL